MVNISNLKIVESMQTLKSNTAIINVGYKKPKNIN